MLTFNVITLKWMLWNKVGRSNFCCQILNTLRSSMHPKRTKIRGVTLIYRELYFSWIDLLIFSHFIFQINLFWVPHCLILLGQNILHLISLLNVTRCDHQYAFIWDLWNVLIFFHISCQVTFSSLSGFVLLENERDFGHSVLNKMRDPIIPSFKRFT